MLFFLLSTLDWEMCAVKIKENVLNRITNTWEQVRHINYESKPIIWYEDKCEYLLFYPLTCTECWKRRFVQVNKYSEIYVCELYSSWVCRSSHFMKSYPHMQNTYVHLILYLKWSKYVTYTFKEVMYFFILKKISVMLYVSFPCKKYFELLINLVNRLNSTGLQRLLKMWSSNFVLCKIFFSIIKSR